MQQVQYTDIAYEEASPQQIPNTFSFKELMEARLRRLEEKSQSAANLRPTKQLDMSNSPVKLPTLKAKAPQPALLKKLNYDFGSLNEFLSYDLKLKKPEELFKISEQGKKHELKNKEEDLKKNLMQHVRPEVDYRDPKTILLEEKDPEKVLKAARRFISDMMGEIFKDEMYVIEKKITQRGIHRLYELVMDLDEDNPVRKIAEKYGYKSLVEKFNILEFEMEKKKNPEIIPFNNNNKKPKLSNIFSHNNVLGRASFSQDSGYHSPINGEAQKQATKGYTIENSKLHSLQNSKSATKNSTHKKYKNDLMHINEDISDTYGLHNIDQNLSPKGKKRTFAQEEIQAFAARLLVDLRSLGNSYQIYQTEEKEQYNKEIKQAEEHGKSAHNEIFELEDDDQLASMSSSHIVFAHCQYKPQFYIHICFNFSFPNLQILNLRGSQVHEALVWLILKLIERYSSVIQDIDLSENHISIRSCEALKEILMKNPMKSLKLANSNLSSKGLALICLGLAQNTTMIDLDLNYNNIDEYGYKTLALILKHTQTLNSVKLLRKKKIVLLPTGEEKEVQEEFGYNVMSMFTKVFKYNKHLDPKNVQLFEGKSK